MKIGDGMRKGFTLIELLGVLVILALLSAIIVPSVTKFITQAEVQVDDSKIKSVETSARNWLAGDNRLLKMDSSAFPCYVSVSTLVQDGFMDKELQQSLENNYDSSNLKVVIRHDDDKFSYKFYYEVSSEIPSNDCSNY